ncbi:MAG TPA: inorganic phosphate transporter [Bryobacteraceae bacterium]|nr:inorganic phosphate transporter [Bryobacteraceae bacterium]
MSPLALVVLIIAVALIFDYLNGFHDAANSIATIVSTRVLTPFQAVLWAAFFNFVSAFTFGTGVAKTMGEGFVNLKLDGQDFVTPWVILAGLMGAIVWNIITWYWGLPTSSSHALIGGYAGAAVAKAALTRGFGNSLDALTLGAWPKTLAFIAVAPLIGLVLAYIIMIAIYWIFQRSSPKSMDYYFRKLQLVSAAAYSFAHGTNDAQKTMGIMTAVLFTAGFLKTQDVPTWVILSAHAAIALGTLSGGWRIVHTMGGRLTRLKPRSGFSAETAAAISIMFSTELHLPVSTTHVIAGSIAGVGSIHRLKAVRWGIATSILWAWVLTIPAAASISWFTFLIIWMINPSGL